MRFITIDAGERSGVAGLRGIDMRRNRAPRSEAEGGRGDLNIIDLTSWSTTAALKPEVPPWLDSVSDKHQATERVHGGDHGRACADRSGLRTEGAGL